MDEVGREPAHQERTDPMADSDPGRENARARGQRDSGRYFLLPSETAERFRRDEHEPETAKRTTDEDTGEDG